MIEKDDIQAYFSIALLLPFKILLFLHGTLNIFFSTSYPCMTARTSVHAAACHRNRPRPHWKPSPRISLRCSVKWPFRSSVIAPRRRRYELKLTQLCEGWDVERSYPSMAILFWGASIGLWVQSIHGLWVFFHWSMQIQDNSSRIPEGTHSFAQEKLLHRRSWCTRSGLYMMGTIGKSF